VGDDAGTRLSHDGARIAVMSNRDGNTEIYTMNHRGPHQTRLTNNPPETKPPSWAPDWIELGRQTATAMATHELYFMRSSRRLPVLTS
jgi:hypothetical protein